MDSKEKLLNVLSAIFVVVFLISMAGLLYLIFPIDTDEAYQGILAIYMFAVFVVSGIVLGITEYRLQKIGWMILVSAVLLVAMVACGKHLEFMPSDISDIKEYGVCTFTVSQGGHERTGGGSRQNPRKDKYYVKYDAELEDGTPISFTEKVSGEEKMKELVDNQDTRVHAVFRTGYRYVFGDADDTKEVMMEKLTGWTKYVYIMAAAYAGIGIVVLLVHHFQKRTEQEARQEQEWTLIIDGDEQETVDWESIEKAVMNLDVMEEEAYVVLVRYIDTDKEEHLQVFADLDAEGELVFTIDRGIQVDDVHADYYVHYADDLEEVKEFFRLYYQEDTIDYDEFEEA